MAVAESFRLLVVCTANECRSVFTADQLASLPVTRSWSVASAGTEPTPGTGVCTEMLSFRPHASAHLDTRVITAADLVLVMEREHRSRVAELSPAARAKVFTLLEAARLAEFVAAALAGIAPNSAEFSSTKPRGWTGLSRTAQLRWLVSEMHEARSYIDAPAEEDVKDAHGEGALPHAQVRSEIEAACRALSAALEQVIG